MNIDLKKVEIGDQLVLTGGYVEDITHKNDTAISGSSYGWTYDFENKGTFQDIIEHRPKAKPNTVDLSSAKVGDEVELRNGSKATVTHISRAGIVSGDGIAWFLDGLRNRLGECPYDVVRHIPKPEPKPEIDLSKLPFGTKMRRRDGRLIVHQGAAIHCTMPYQWRGSDDVERTNNGKAYDGLINHYLDIIEILDSPEPKEDGDFAKECAEKMIGAACQTLSEAMPKILPEKLFLQVSGPEGPFYRTAGDHEVRLYWIDSIIHGAWRKGSDEWNLYSWSHDGTSYNEWFNIVSLWTDEPEKPVVDWSKLAEFHTHAAMDRDGEWFVFNGEPTMDGNLWLSSKDGASCLPPEYAPKWQGDWKKSLVERPA